VVFHSIKKSTPVNYTYFPNAFFSILLTSLILMFLYCRYRSVVAKSVNNSHSTLYWHIIFTLLC